MLCWFFQANTEIWTCGNVPHLASYASFEPNVPHIKLMCVRHLVGPDRPTASAIHVRPSIAISVFVVCVHSSFVVGFHSWYRCRLPGLKSVIPVSKISSRSYHFWSGNRNTPDPASFFFRYGKVLDGSDFSQCSSVATYLCCFHPSSCPLTNLTHP
jgi:hypothetical protein